MMQSLNKVTFWLTIIGAMNWLLVALGYNLIELLLSGMPSIVKLIYLIIGTSGVYQLLIVFGEGKKDK